MHIPCLFPLPVQWPRRVNGFALILLVGWPCPRNVTHILVVNDVNMRSLLTYINERGRLYLLFIHKLGGGLRLFKINNNKKKCIGRNTGPRHRLEIERYAFVILGGKMETPSSFVSFYDNKERFFLLKKYDFSQNTLKKLVLLYGFMYSLFIVFAWF